MRQHGYTLIELMVVLLLLVILAFISFQAYQVNIIRARISEGMHLVASAKLHVSETTLEHNSLPANQAETGYLSPTATANVANISIANDGSGAITITFTPAAGNGTIIFSPSFVDREIIWTCTGGTLAARYRPPSCR